MKALLIMDMVNEYIYGEKPLINTEKRGELISNIKYVVDLAHKKEIPVIYVNSAFRKRDKIMKVIGHRPQAIKGTKGAETISELKPIPQDIVLEKRGYDGFWKSGLKKKLNELNVQDIYLAGEQTDCCIRETGVTAAHLGFNVFIIEDCCDTNRELWQESAIKFIRACVGKIANSKNIVW